MPPDSLIRRLLWIKEKRGIYRTSIIAIQAYHSLGLNDIEGRINCPSELSMLRYDGNGRISRYYKTERASNLTLSQSVIELAIRLAEKESLTLFFSNGISLPSDSAKI